MPEDTRLKSQIAYDRIQLWIQSGQYGPGDRLPSEQALASELDMNHLTVRRALARLAEEGVIEKRPKIGTFVSAAPSPIPVAIVLPRWAISQEVAKHPYFSTIVAGIHSVLEQQRYAVSTMYYSPNRLWEEVGRIVSERSVRGMLLGASADIRPSEVQRLIDTGIRTVLLHGRPKLARFGLPSVTIEYVSLLRQVIERLVSLGHRKIAVAAYSRSAERQMIIRAVSAACDAHDLGSLSDVLLDIPNPPNKVDLSVMRSLVEKRNRPTAVVVPDEFAASTVFRLCYEHGIRIPQQMSLAAVYDSTPQHHPVPLTAPDTPSAAIEMGRCAAGYLADMLQNRDVPAGPTVIEAKMNWLESIAPPDGVESYPPKSIDTRSVRSDRS